MFLVGGPILLYSSFPTAQHTYRQGSQGGGGAEREEKSERARETKSVWEKIRPTPTAQGGSTSSENTDSLTTA